MPMQRLDNLEHENRVVQGNQLWNGRILYRFVDIDKIHEIDTRL